MFCFERSVRLALPRGKAVVDLDAMPDGWRVEVWQASPHRACRQHLLKRLEPAHPNDTHDKPTIAAAAGDLEIDVVVVLGKLCPPTAWPPFHSLQASFNLVSILWL